MKLRAKRSKLVLDNLEVGSNTAVQDQTMLIVSLSPLSFLKNDKLSYCFIERKLYKSGLPRDEVRAMFQKFLEDLRRTMGLSKKYCFLYRRDGQECHDIYDVARS